MDAPTATRRTLDMNKHLTRAVLLALCLMLASSLAARAAPSPKMLVETIDLASPAISPDGLSVAFRQDQASVDQNRYEVGWYIQPLDGSRTPLRVADAGDPLRYVSGPSLNEPPKWSADGRWIYYRALIDGAVQVWRAASDGSRAEAVTQDAADVENFALSADGRRLFYTAGAPRERIERAEQEEADRGILIDRTVSLDQGLFRSGYINGRLADERLTGQWMDVGGLLAGQPRRQIVVDLASRASHDASDDERAAFAGQMPITVIKASTAPTNQYDLRVRSDLDGSIAYVEQVGLYKVPHVAKTASAATSIACDAKPCQKAMVTGMAWRPGHDEVVFTTRERETGSQSLYAWDVASGAVRLVASAPGLVGGGRGLAPGETCSVSDQAAACVMASADVPPHLERIDLQTGRRLDLYDPNASLVAARGPRAQFLSWADEKGRLFTGQYFPPDAGTVSGPAPLFITYYSCNGYLRGGMGEEWPLASLAGAGIAALCIQAPPMDGTDQVGSYETALSGTERIVAVLKARRLVDPTKVGLGGLSFGSEVVMWVMMHSNVLAAASVATPTLTPSYYLMHELQGANFKSTLMKSWGLAAPSETPETWKRLSPVFNIGQMQAPLLMQMSEQEYLNALDYYVPLAQSPTPVELYVFPNEPHLPTMPRHLLAANERNLDWFRFWLQGYVDPDPAKAEQYARWQAMKARSLAAGRHPGEDRPALSGQSRRGALQP